MQPYGDNRRRLMLIGEGPGETEDIWVNLARPRRQLFVWTMRDLGIDVFTDCVSLNAVNCRPLLPTPVAVSAIAWRSA